MRRKVSLVGDTMNICSRLCSAAGNGEHCVSFSVQQHIASLIRHEEAVEIYVHTLFAAVGEGQRQAERVESGTHPRISR